MSHQRAGHIYLMGRAQGAKTSLSCVELAIVVRIHTCVLVRPCCRCQALLPHRSTNDGVELPDGTPRGVRDLYPVWLPCFFSPFPAAFASPSLPPPAYLLSSSPFDRPASPNFLSFSRGSCRTVAPAAKMFCKTNVCICTLDRARNPLVVGDRR